MFGLIGKKKIEVIYWNCCHLFLTDLSQGLIHSAYLQSIIFKMSTLQSTLFSVLLASAGAKAANIFVSHFEGEVSTLSLNSTNNATYSLDVSSSSTDCGRLPSWLTLDSASGTLYCTDEWWEDDSTVSALSLGADDAVTDTVQATAFGGAVHSTLYSGADGAQYLASAH